MKRFIPAGGDAHPKPAETRMDAASHGGAERVRGRSGARLTDADYAAIVKRYEDAGDLQNADIIRQQWTVACGGAGAHPGRAETRMDTGSAAGAGPSGAHLRPPCRSSKKVQAVQELPVPADVDSRQVVVIGGQRVGKQALLDLQRDAARYRWLRDKADSMACTAAPMVASLDVTGRMVDLIDGEELDAAVDMAMTLPGARRTPKSKIERAIAAGKAKS